MNGGDKEFITAVTQSGLGTVERLPKNCQATHVFRIDGQEHVLPVKFYLEFASKRWNLLRGEYRGIIVLWLTCDQRVLVCHTSDLTTGHVSSSLILKKYPVSLCTDFSTKLVTAYQDYRVELKDVMEHTKCKVATREEALLRPSNNGLEAAGHEEFISLLGSNYWKETPEKCRADGGYHIGDPDLCLATQTKTCTVAKDGNLLNTFHSTSGYDGIILMCRPMTRLYIGTVVMPGALAPKDIRLTLTTNSKYMPYLIPDTQLCTFLRCLYDAVNDGKATHVWPSGVEVNISDLKLVKFASLCMPENANDILERQNHEWRLSVLPDFSYDLPKVQGTTVDVLMNGLRIQDKPARSQKGQKGLRVSVTKNNGRVGGKCTVTAYVWGDFDALFVFLPDKTRFFFVIPAQDLLKHELLSTATIKGKTSFYCYPSDCEFSKRGPKPDLWTQQFCFDLRDPNIREKITALLESCKT